MSSPAEENGDIVQILSPQGNGDIVQILSPQGNGDIVQMIPESGTQVISAGHAYQLIILYKIMLLQSSLV